LVGHTKAAVTLGEAANQSHEHAAG